MREGIQLSEALTGDGAAIFRHACGLGLEGIVSKRIGSRYVSGLDARLAENEEPALWAYLTRMLSNADLDCLIADLRTNPLTKQELRPAPLIAINSLPAVLRSDRIDHMAMFFVSAVPSSKAARLALRVRASVHEASKIELFTAHWNGGEPAPEE